MYIPVTTEKSRPTVWSAIKGSGNAELLQLLTTLAIALAMRNVENIILYFPRVYGFSVTQPAGVAQLAEHNVANVVVVGSNPITRS